MERSAQLLNMLPVGVAVQKLVANGFVCTCCGIHHTGVVADTLHTCVCGAARVVMGECRGGGNKTKLNE